MFEEESLDSGQDSTGTTLVLEDGIIKLLVEVESLVPRVVETSSFVAEKKHFDS